MIRFNVLRTGPDTILTQVDHPQSSPFESTSRLVAIKGGFEMRPVNEEPNEKNIARFMIVDDSTMKLVFVQGEAENEIVRMRCPPVAGK